MAGAVTFDLLSVLMIDGAFVCVSQKFFKTYKVYIWPKWCPLLISFFLKYYFIM